ncbi:MAG TPA: hypothetical protein VN259_00130, partial [Xanthomonadales bacterium]|nr:hypothetical protein [Xanthomonadales bacterium]
MMPFDRCPQSTRQSCEAARRSELQAAIATELRAVDDVCTQCWRILDPQNPKTDTIERSAGQMRDAPGG